MATEDEVDPVYAAPLFVPRAMFTVPVGCAPAFNLKEPFTSRLAVGLATPMPTLVPFAVIGASKTALVAFFVCDADTSTTARTSATSTAVKATSSEILASAMSSSYDIRKKRPQRQVVVTSLLSGSVTDVASSQLTPMSRQVPEAAVPAIVTLFF